MLLLLLEALRNPLRTDDPGTPCPLNLLRHRPGCRLCPSAGGELQHENEENGTTGHSTSQRPDRFSFHPEVGEIDGGTPSQNQQQPPGKKAQQSRQTVFPEGGQLFFSLRNSLPHAFQEIRRLSGGVRLAHLEGFSIGRLELLLEARVAAHRTNALPLQLLEVLFFLLQLGMQPLVHSGQLFQRPFPRDLVGHGPDLQIGGRLALQFFSPPGQQTFAGWKRELNPLRPRRVTGFGMLLLVDRTCLRRRDGLLQQFLFLLASLLKGPLGGKAPGASLLGSRLLALRKLPDRPRQSVGELQSSADSKSSPHNRAGLWLESCRSPRSPGWLPRYRREGFL